MDFKIEQSKIYILQNPVDIKFNKWWISMSNWQKTCRLKFVIPPSKNMGITNPYFIKLLNRVFHNIADYCMMLKK